MNDHPKFFTDMVASILGGLTSIAVGSLLSFVGNAAAALLFGCLGTLGGYLAKKAIDRYEKKFLNKKRPPDTI